jgi:hypothetical protein
LQLPVFPEASVAEQVPVLVPTGKVEPEGGAQVAATALQLSTAVAETVATAPPLEHSIV